MSAAGMGFSSRARALFAASVFGLIAAANIPAIEVDRAELEKSGRERIVFISYEGPHARIDSLEDILGIGRALGRAVRSGAVRAGDPRRYSAAHVAGAGQAGALDADIIGLGVDAGVDHIRNLRLILRGYLEEAYGYATRDASLLAEFITVYNAVYRGDWNYFSTRYSAPVISSLDKDKAGLSVRFDEWPGRALIVIPLSDGAARGSLSAVDTTPLTEKKVVDELRKKDDMGIESRKEMVDLKEREAAEAKQKAELQREAIVAEEKRLAEEKAKLEAEKAKLEAEKKAAADAQKAAAAVSGEGRTAEAAKAAEERKAAVDEKEKEVAAQEKAVAEKEAAVEGKKEEAAKAEELAEKKESEAAAERADIAKDQQAVIAKEDAAKTPAPIGELSLRMVSGDGPFARFVLVEIATGKELKASAVDTVRGRSAQEMGGMIVAVAGRTGGSGAVRLILVDRKSLEMLKQGDDDIHEESPVWISGENIYALAVSGGAARLALFDKELKRKAVSEARVHPYASLRFAEGAVLTQAADGAPIVLNAADLKTAVK